MPRYHPADVRNVSQWPPEPTFGLPLQRPLTASSQVRGRFMLVGDTGIEPVTSSVSGINTVLSTPPLSTKTVRGRPPMSAHIRGRCHAISQSPRHPHISERPRTVHPRFPRGSSPENDLESPCIGRWAPTRSLFRTPVMTDDPRRPATDNR